MQGSSTVERPGREALGAAAGRCRRAVPMANGEVIHATYIPTAAVSSSASPSSTKLCLPPIPTPPPPPKRHRLGRNRRHRITRRIPASSRHQMCAHQSVKRRWRAPTARPASRDVVVAARVRTWRAHTHRLPTREHDRGNASSSGTMRRAPNTHGRSRWGGARSTAWCRSVRRRERPPSTCRTTIT